MFWTTNFLTRFTEDKLLVHKNNLPEEWTPEDVELVTLSDALWIDSVPVVRLFDRCILPMRAVLLVVGFADSSLLRVTTKKLLRYLLPNTAATPVYRPVPRTTWVWRYRNVKPLVGPVKTVLICPTVVVIRLKHCAPLVVLVGSTQSLSCTAAAWIDALVLAYPRCPGAWFSKLPILNLGLRFSQEKLKKT